MKSYKNLQLAPVKAGFEIKDVVKPMLPVSLPSYECGLVERPVTPRCVQSGALMTGENVRPGFYRELPLIVENKHNHLVEVT